MGKAPYTFEIEANGSWSYTLERIDQTYTTSFTGHGDYVTDIFSGSSGTWHFKHIGGGNFIVWLITTDGRDLLVNEIGDYDGNRLLSIPAGSNALLVIKADGTWSAAPAE